MQIGSGRLLLLSVALGDEQDDLVFRERGLDRRKRRGAANQKRNDYIGENDNIPKRKDRNPVRRRDAFIVALKYLRQRRLDEVREGKLLNCN
jgi:hypothetical protein